MKHQYTQHELIAVSECRYCDGGSPHRPYGWDDVAVCTACGAEWDPIVVHYTAEEVGLWEPDHDEDHISADDWFAFLKNNPEYLPDHISEEEWIAICEGNPE